MNDQFRRSDHLVIRVFVNLTFTQHKLLKREFCRDLLTVKAALEAIFRSIQKIRSPKYPLFTLAGKFEILLEILVAVCSRNKTLLVINQINNFRILGGSVMAMTGVTQCCSQKNAFSTTFRMRANRLWHLVCAHSQVSTVGQASCSGSCTALFIVLY